MTATSADCCSSCRRLLLLPLLPTDAAPADSCCSCRGFCSCRVSDPGGLLLLTCLLLLPAAVVPDGGYCPWLAGCSSCCNGGCCSCLGFSPDVAAAPIPVAAPAISCCSCQQLLLLTEATVPGWLSTLVAAMATAAPASEEPLGAGPLLLFSQAFLLLPSFACSLLLSLSGRLAAWFFAASVAVL
jgi:hypothetical protein